MVFLQNKMIKPSLPQMPLLYGAMR